MVTYTLYSEDFLEYQNFSYDIVISKSINFTTLAIITLTMMISFDLL